MDFGGRILISNQIMMTEMATDMATSTAAVAVLTGKE
jgi:hypothetical protein